MTPLARYAVIPTRGRPYDLADCLRAITPQVQAVVIIDNNDTPSPLPAHPYPNLVVLHDPEQPPNLSRLWNRGLDEADRLADEVGALKWDVAILNDDVVVAPTWLRALSVRLRLHDGGAASANPRGDPVDVVLTEPGPTLPARLVGYAFVLAGEKGLRADERLRWWYSDDDLDWTARGRGGTVLVPPTAEVAVEHRYPNVSTHTSPALSAQAVADRLAFNEKWGGLMPW